MHTKKIGQGPAVFTHDYIDHANQYYYGNSPEHALAELDKLNITINDNVCSMEDKVFRVISLNNAAIDSLDWAALTKQTFPL